MLEFPKHKYNIILADPPWSFGGGGVYQDRNRPVRETKKQYFDICSEGVIQWAHSLIQEIIHFLVLMELI